MYDKYIKENQRKAFIHYVTAWKKQSADSVRVEDGIYSYTTKRGITHRFRASNKPTGLKVNSFYFEEIEQTISAPVD